MLSIWLLIHLSLLIVTFSFNSIDCLCVLAKKDVLVVFKDDHLFFNDDRLEDVL